MLKLAGLVLLVALVLVGALMPLRYTARMHLPKQSGGTRGGTASGPLPGTQPPRED
jgi:hypothetical protein